jgi:tripartite-type tricarboxylate transporter receptor subunit TctC
MTLPRRRFLQLAASASALPALGRVASAQTYPSRPVQLLVGYAPGGVNDIVARLTGQMVAERLGQQFIIENRPGAGSNLATEAVARANPDGYTLLEASTSNGWNATIYQNLKFDFIRDIAPVASTVKTYNAMIVNPRFRRRTVPEFIAYAKANPGQDQHGVGRSWKLTASLRRAVQGDDRRRYGDGALSRRCPRDTGAHRGANPGHVRLRRDLD